MPAPKKRQIAQSKSNVNPSESSSRPTRPQNASSHSQQFMLAQTPSSRSKHHSSAPHGASTFGHEVTPCITNEYQNLHFNNFFQPADARESPGLHRTDYRGTLNATQPCLTTTQNSVGTGFAGLSAVMFPSAEPSAYPKQPMGSIGADNPIKLEDTRIWGWYDTKSPTVDEPAAPGTLALGAYPSYLMSGQHPGFGAGAQDMRLPLDMNHQAFGNRLTVPTEGVDSGWTSDPTPSDNRQGMNIDHLGAADWNPAWMHPGYGP
jgi:hypothetical protein